MIVTSVVVTPVNVVSIKKILHLRGCIVELNTLQSNLANVEVSYCLIHTVL